MKIKNTLLLLNGGRRVELIEHWRKTFKDLGVNVRIAVSDIQGLAPALYAGDVAFQLPRSRDGNFKDCLFDLCKKEGVYGIIPLIDPDLEVLASLKGSLLDCDVRVLISSPETISICRDKKKTISFLKERGFPVPKTLDRRDVTPRDYPLFIKPNGGSSSVNTFKIHNEKELDFFIDYVEDPILQRFSSGEEYTVDVFGDENGNVLSSSPRLRMNVRAGEVNTARIVRSERVESLALDVAKSLNIIGPANVQLIKGDAGLGVLEINPRFGGGVPLSIEAGMPFLLWAHELLTTGECLKHEACLKNGLTMMRYDQSFFVNENEIQL